LHGTLDPQIVRGLKQTMLPVGEFRSRTCGGLSRRSFLQLGAALPLALTGALNPTRAAARARARSVIFVWLWGAPSHLDTFDPKPAAPAEVRGPFAAIATRTPGMLFSELLPGLASRSHLFNVIRSHVNFASDHPAAGTFALTGFPEKPEPVHASFGSLVGKHRGQKGKLPPFVAVGRGIPRDVVRIIDGYGGGRLGKLHDPFLISCADDGQTEVPSLELLKDLTPQRLSDRRSLLRRLDAAHRAIDAAGAAGWERACGRAHDLLTVPEARAAFDLSREKEATRESYGQTSFGQSCLLARRLVEAGVNFVQVNWSQYVEAMTPNCDFGWDTHIYNFELLQDRHCPILDRALSALLDDLHQRGLLDSTLVVAMGEFGRTPRINDRVARDHWHRCYSSLWAGAGLRAGRVIGQSNKHAEDPITAPVTPLMVGTTIAELAGIDAQARAEMQVLPGGTVIDELLA
jgi:uncharacterized protein (DUF1501 family)